jgi:hypothetical protein
MTDNIITITFLDNKDGKVFENNKRHYKIHNGKGHISYIAARKASNAKLMDFKPFIP